jgi:hypothetical protein
MNDPLKTTTESNANPERGHDRQNPDSAEGERDRDERSRRTDRVELPTAEELHGPAADHD